MSPQQQLPIVDISKLVSGEAYDKAARQIRQACQQQGFFYVVGHNVSESLQDQLESLSRDFFSLPLESKMRIRMTLGGRAWRGYFPVGDELTSGVPDAKEGLYFGSELPLDDPRVMAEVPLHGSNLFPDLPDFRETVLQYIDAMTELGHHLMRGMAASLELDPDYFRTNYTNDPVILFRIFHYPPQAISDSENSWGVGEHTDYGLLTILRQDDQDGLQVKCNATWIDAPPIRNSFVCNIGDMLDRMTGGLYRSTPHRVRNRNQRGRLSFPFFFDPSFDAEVRPVFPERPAAERWDGTNLQDLSGTYGEYLLGKVSRVFPDLSDDL